MKYLVKMEFRNYPGWAKPGPFYAGYWVEASDEASAVLVAILEHRRVHGTTTIVDARVIDQRGVS